MRLLALALAALLLAAPAAASESHPTQGELESELKRARPVVMAVIGTVGLVVLIFLMVFKPF